MSKTVNCINQKVLTTISGDGCRWLIAGRDAVLDNWYMNEERKVMQSSLNSKTHSVKWYRRQEFSEDPWISLVDYDRASYLDEMLYGENGNDSLTQTLNSNNGANVYIRYLGKTIL